MISKDDRHHWLFRRRYLFVVTAFIMLLMGWSALGMAGDSLGEVILTNGFWTLAALTGTYVFGATWDHANQRKFGKTNEPASEPAKG
jgi:hypothetical protein